MRQLTQAEIGKLSEFTQKHYVEYYDVQLELVDHLANAIEEKWKVDPNTSFEEALNTEFKKFGIFGFSTLVEQKQQDLHRYYTRLLWQNFKSYFTLPKLVVSLLIYLLVYYSLDVFGEVAVLFWVSVLFIGWLFFIVDSIMFSYKNKKQQQQSGKKYLLQSISGSIYTLPIVSFSGLSFSLIKQYFVDDSGLIPLGMHLLTLLVLAEVISYIVFYRVVKPTFLREQELVEQRYKWA